MNTLSCKTCAFSSSDMLKLREYIVLKKMKDGNGRRVSLTRVIPSIVHEFVEEIVCPYLEEKEGD